MSDNKLPDGLALLRAPFPAHQISKLPKPTKAQTDAVRADFKSGIRCTICGTWHHPQVVHLDYVGHAALTDRLLDVDPEWSWEPLAYTADGLPRFDERGGLWIRLTVLGVTRLGYGHADGKSGGDAIKEIIGDAIRNAAMRGGAALELWHKGDLHIDQPEAAPESEPEAAPEGRQDPQPQAVPGKTVTPQQLRILSKALERKGLPVDAMLAEFGIPALDQLPASRINDAIQWISQQGVVAGTGDASVAV
jgi:hypothetical protein